MPRVPLIPPPTSQTTGEPSFRWRRIAFFGIVGYCMAFMPWLAYMPEMPANNLKLAQSLNELLGWAFLVYAAGAGAQDIVSIITTKSARPYADPAPAVNTIETETKTKTVVAADPASVDPTTRPSDGE